MAMSYAKDLLFSSYPYLCLFAWLPFLCTWLLLLHFRGCCCSCCCCCCRWLLAGAGASAAASVGVVVVLLVVAMLMVVLLLVAGFARCCWCQCVRFLLRGLIYVFDHMLVVAVCCVAVYVHTYVCHSFSVVLPALAYVACQFVPQVFFGFCSNMCLCGVLKGGTDRRLEGRKPRVTLKDLLRMDEARRQ